MSSRRFNNDRYSIQWKVMVASALLSLFHWHSLLFVEGFIAISMVVKFSPCLRT